MQNILKHIRETSKQVIALFVKFFKPVKSKDKVLEIPSEVSKMGKKLRIYSLAMT